MPKINTGFSAAHMRATAAAIPVEPVIKSTSSTCLFEQMFEALTVGFVKRFQLRSGAAVTNKLIAGQDHWFHSPSQQRFRGRAANHIDDHRSGDRGDRSSPPLQ